MSRKKTRRPAKKAGKPSKRKAARGKPRERKEAPVQVPAPAPTQAPAAAPAPPQPPVPPQGAATASPETEGGAIRAGLRSLHEKYESLLREARIGEEQRKEIEQELAALSRRPLGEVAAALGISREAAKNLIDMVESMNTQP